MQATWRAIAVATTLALGLPAFAAAAPASASKALAHVDAGNVKLGYRIEAAPFSFVERGTVRGYTVELCERAIAAIAAARKVAPPSIRWVPLDASMRIDAVARGDVDAECGTTTITLARRERVDFSVPIYVDGGSVLARAGVGIARIADLAGKRVAVISDTTTRPALQRALAAYGANATLVAVANGDDGMKALQDGRADAYAGDRIVLTSLLRRSDTPAAFVFVGDDFSYEPYAIVVARDDPDFRLALDRALVATYKSGDIDAIFARWFGDLGRPGPLLNAMFYLNMLPE